MKKLVFFYILFFNQKQYTMMDVFMVLKTGSIGALNGVASIVNGNGSATSRALNTSHFLCAIAGASYVCRIYSNLKEKNLKDLKTIQGWIDILKIKDKKELFNFFECNLFLMLLFGYCKHQYDKTPSVE